ncbi:LysR family transcriptional regulator [Photobacterium damselae subsp. damselae]|uniref:LysR family transcriptional regulator n=1 Tax=Photobacterium damselae TaxID=38293 RepID=UPI000D082756|nr:LysR family transcriptional regulator [Photobacterium damselae]PSB84452.1 LysR family transcriptional regulator [Photobacterium damselae subsp. damselae]
MDQLGAMRIFIRVVQTGSFSAAAREENTTQATISKKISALENKLKGKLLTRSSRELSLTEIGAEFYERCISIISELDQAEANVRSHITSPQGVIKVTAPITFGTDFLAPILPEFLSTYPEVKINLTLSDKHVDIITEGIDVAIRARELEDSSLVARYLFENKNYVVASPQYLKQYGTPNMPEDLKNHNCLVYSMLSSINIWNFNLNTEKTSVQVTGNLQTDNCDVILQLLLSHIGIAQLPHWMVQKYLDNGELVQILNKYQTKPLPFHAIYPKHHYTPLKVRCFIDFIKSKVPLIEEDSKME